MTYVPLGVTTVEWAKPRGLFQSFESVQPFRGLEGLGSDCPWYERWAFNGTCPADLMARDAGVSVEGDTSGFSADEIRAYIDAAPPGSTIRFSSQEHTTTTTATAPAPSGPSRTNWFMYGAFALGAAMLVFGGRR